MNIPLARKVGELICSNGALPYRSLIKGPSGYSECVINIPGRSKGGTLA